MAIKKPEQLDFSNKNFTLIIDNNRRGASRHRAHPVDGLHDFWMEVISWRTKCILN